MFDPTKEVPSLELCKELKKLGFPQNRAGWFWVKWEPEEPYILAITFDGRNYHNQSGRTSTKPPFRIKAPTLHEVGEWLPEEFEEFKLDGKFWVKDRGDYNHLVSDENEINARTKMLIWLAKEGYICFIKYGLA